MSSVEVPAVGQMLLATQGRDVVVLVMKHVIKCRDHECAGILRDYLHAALAQSQDPDAAMLRKQYSPEIMRAFLLRMLEPAANILAEHGDDSAAKNTTIPKPKLRSGGNLN